MPKLTKIGAKLSHNDSLAALLGGDPTESDLALGMQTPAAPPKPAKEPQSLQSGYPRRPRQDSGTPEPIPAVLHELPLAQLLGVSASQVRYLAKEGIAVRVQPSHYAVQPTIANYISRLSERAKKAGNPRADGPLAAEKLRVATAQADKIELANAKARGDMVPAGEVERAWSNILRDVRSALLAVPSRIGATLPHLSAHDVAALDREIKAALEGLANGN